MKKAKCHFQLMVVAISICFGVSVDAQLRWVVESNQPTTGQVFEVRTLDVHEGITYFGGVGNCKALTEPQAFYGKIDECGTHLDYAFEGTSSFDAVRDILVDDDYVYSVGRTGQIGYLLVQDHDFNTVFKTGLQWPGLGIVQTNANQIVAWRGKHLVLGTLSTGSDRDAFLTLVNNGVEVGTRRFVGATSDLAREVVPFGNNTGIVGASLTGGDRDVAFIGLDITLSLLPPGYSLTVSDRNSLNALEYGEAAVSIGDVVYIVGYQQDGALQEAIAMALDVSSAPVSVVWFNRYSFPGYSSVAVDVIVNDGNLLVIGGMEGASSDSDLFLMELNPTDGSIIWDKKYDIGIEGYTFPQQITDVLDAFDMEDAIAFGAPHQNISGDATGILARIDDNGTVGSLSCVMTSSGFTASPIVPEVELLTYSVSSNNIFTTYPMDSCSGYSLDTADIGYCIDNPCTPKPSPSIGMHFQNGVLHLGDKEEELLVGDPDNALSTSIYSVDGRLVSSATVRNGKMNLQHLDSGMYIVIVSRHGVVQSRKRIYVH